MHSNYDKQPYVVAEGFGNEHCFAGYDEILKELSGKFKNKKKVILAIDCYPGVRVEVLKKGLIEKIPASLVIYSDEEAFYDDACINEKIKDCMTDDRVFGIMTHFKLKLFLDDVKTEKIRQKIRDTAGIIVIYGVGASLVFEPDLYVYADLARWEIQHRYRSGEIPNWKSDNYTEDVLKKFKRGYFFEWRIADEHKKNNYAWAFDCVPEENSLLIKVGDLIVETPAMNLVLRYPKELLGEKVFAMFGEQYSCSGSICYTIYLYLYSLGLGQAWTGWKAAPGTY